MFGFYHSLLHSDGDDRIGRNYRHSYTPTARS